MVNDWFHNIIKPGSVTPKNGLWIANAFLDKTFKWSFADEWNEHSRTNQQKTWDWTAKERVEQFYIETKTSSSALQDKIILDAGCGNGQLTKALADAGANIIGIDVHPYLPAQLSTEKLQFIQGDFDEPPFNKKSFDIIIANGTIHHTKDTFHSFQSLASLVKPNGKLYVWLYKSPDGMWRKFLLWWLDIFRFFISRFPGSLQKISVNMLTGFFFILSRIRKGKNSKRSKEEIKINVYDAFTPKHRHYHNPVEIATWFSKCGFDEPVLSHWDNAIGFGMVAVKNNPLHKPAGENFTM